MQPAQSNVSPPSPKSRRRIRALPVVRIAIMLFSLVAVAALTLDLVSLRLRAEKAVHGHSAAVQEALISVATATNRWVDAGGRFRLVRPPDWEAVTGGNYDVVLRGPHGLEVAVRVLAEPPGGWDALRRGLRDVEEALHLTTSLQDVTFQGAPAIQRTMPLNKITVRTLDFLRDGRAVHIMTSAPRGAAEDFAPVLQTVAESLELGAAPDSP